MPEQTDSPAARFADELAAALKQADPTTACSVEQLGAEVTVTNGKAAPLLRFRVAKTRVVMGVFVSPESLTGSVDFRGTLTTQAVPLAVRYICGGSGV